MNPCMNARGLLLASASTRYPRGRYRFGFNDRNIILGANSQDRGHHDKVPVLAQHGFEATSEQEAFCIDHECFTQTWRSCLEPRPLSWKGTRRRTVSLLPREECLSLQAEYSTKVQNMQDDIPLRRAIPPRHECAGLPSPISVSLACRKPCRHVSDPKMEKKKDE